MDRITDIEENLATVLYTIQQSYATPTGYIFYSSVGGVNVDDEAIIKGTQKFPIVDIEMNEDGETIVEGQQLAYRSEISYTLRCGVSNRSKSGKSPRREANKKMNEILSDVKYALSDNPTLNGSCDRVYMIGSTRYYNDGNSSNRAGDLLINIRIEYSQSRLNPSLNACI